MKITVVYGTGRKGLSTTYNLAQKVINKLREEDEVYEFFLPKDMNHFCVGCYSCIEGKPEKCGGYDQIIKIKEAMNKSELIIFTVPVYVFHVPGQVKALLDHFAYQWVVHKPNPLMYKKQALIITTAAGGGLKSTFKEMKHSMDAWGIAQLYSYRKAIFKGHWTEIDEKDKGKMEKDILKIADKIYSRKNNVKTRIKVKLLFNSCRLLHKYAPSSEIETQYWKDNGWFGKVRPWKTYNSNYINQ